LAFTWADGAALLAVLLWALTFPVTKYVMEVTTPLAVSAARQALASAIFAVALVAMRRLTLPARRDVLPLLALGLGGQALSLILWALGLRLTTASHAGLIYALTPLLVFGLGHLLGELRIGSRDALGLALGLLGVGAIIGVPALAGGDSGASLVGDLLIGGGAVAWAFWTSFAAPYLRRYGALRTTAWLTAISAVGLLGPASPDLLALARMDLPWQVPASLLYAGAMSGAAGGLLWYAAVRHIGPARTVIYANMESLFVVISAALMLGERVEMVALTGGLAVVAGVLLTRKPMG
jgi:drug/metabolite transporter (DMT)-like permease